MWRLLSAPLQITNEGDEALGRGALGPGRRTQILDARELEERSGLSKPAFFEKYGFVLLKRPS